MKIARIEIYGTHLPYAGGSYGLSGGRSYTGFDATYARVITDTGLEGWGETTPFGATYIAADATTARAALDTLAPALIGQDPRACDAIYGAMDAVMRGQRHAKTALDVACWDIAGKAANLPVYTLLGGQQGMTENTPIPVISSIPTDTPDEMRRNIERHRQAGFIGHSIKIGAAEEDGGPALDAERISVCLADRRPGEWFLADANGGMRPEQLRRLFALLPDGLDFVVEAPCLVIMPNFVGVIVCFVMALNHSIWPSKPEINVAHFCQASLTILAVTKLCINIFNSTAILLMLRHSFSKRGASFQPETCQVLLHLHQFSLLVD